MGAIVDELAFFCKSYRRDLDRCSRLVDSIRMHNRDCVPFYLSVPAADRSRFVNRIGTDAVRYISDEEIVGGPVRQSWVSQQLVKLRFAERGLAVNYLWIDSDFLILREFQTAEFFAYPGVPFTVMFEARRDPYYERIVGDGSEDREYSRMLDGVYAAYTTVRDWFGRKGPLYFFGAPAIWSASVVRQLEQTMRARGLSFEGMLALAPYEMSWYGEFLLSRPVMPLVPRAGLAVCFTRDWQYRRFLASGFTLDEFARAGYLAANCATKWMLAPHASRLRSDRRMARHSKPRGGYG